MDKMSSLFKGHRHQVAFYRLTSEGYRENILGKIKGFVSGIYSPKGVRGMREVLEREKN